MTKTLIDYIPEEDYARYNELLDMATAAKAAAPKPVRQRKPLTAEAKAKAAATRLAKAQAALEALLAQQASEE